MGFVARYTQGKHLAIELFAGDAFEIAAGLLLGVTFIGLLLALIVPQALCSLSAERRQ